MGNSSDLLLLMLNDHNIDKSTQNYAIRKVMNIDIRYAYYVFAVATNHGIVLNCWTFDLVNIYTCLSFYYIDFASRSCYCFFLKVFYVVMLVFQMASYTLP